MSNRWNAARQLAGELGHITMSMGGLILQTTTRGEPTTYYEDHF